MTYEESRRALPAGVFFMINGLTMGSSEVVDKFFALKSPLDIANLLEIDSDKLRYHLYILTSENRYRIFYIQKKSGGYRKISMPISNLKLIQKKLKEVLASVYRPNEFVVHGFVPNRNIVTNARTHCNSDYKAKHLFNIDLLDFFPSINFGRVRGLFMARPYSLPPSVATVLAQICCFDNELPQGAPTSPIISNMICRNLDDGLNRLAHDFRCVYTRYADDLTFSTDLTRGFPMEIVEYNSLEDIKPGKQLTHIIDKNGFNINYKKVRLQNHLCRQEVTGLVINSECPNVRRVHIRQIRAMLHAWEKYGLEKAERHFLDNYDTKRRSPYSPPPSFSQVVRGKIEFLGMVKGHSDSLYLKYLEKFNEIINGNRNDKSSVTEIVTEQENKNITRPEQNEVAQHRILVESDNLDLPENKDIPGSFELLLAKIDENQ